MRPTLATQTATEMVCRTALRIDGNRVVEPGETDPLNPDSDGDGVYDGAEDRNANGEQDEGELDPGDPDSDDDGIVDGLEDRTSDGVYQAPGEGEEFSGETDGLNPDTDGDGLVDGLDEDRNGNGQVDPGENNPRVADVNEGSPQVQICATLCTSRRSRIRFASAPRWLALPTAVYGGRWRELCGGIAVGLAYDVEADRGCARFHDQHRTIRSCTQASRLSARLYAGTARCRSDRQRRI